MPLAFPASPSVNDAYTVGQRTWTWDGYIWSLSADTIGSASVTASELASNAVTTAKILDANVTAAKIASDAVTTAKILDSNVTSGKIASGAAVTNIGYTPANIASPTFTGTPTLPTGTVATTQTAADNTTKIATTAFVTTAVAAVSVDFSSDQNIISNELFR